MTLSVPGLRPAATAALLALLLAAALASGGCASAPPYEPPDPAQTPGGFALPDSWQQAPAGVAGATDPGPAWWTTYGDAELDALIAEALERNRDLAVAGARIEAAAAQARIAGADLSPQVAAALDASRRRQNFIGLPIPGGGDVLSSTSTSLGAGLDVSWEVDLWGRLRAGAGTALAGVEAADADRAAAELSIAGQTAKAWFGLLEALRQAELAGDEATNRARASERIRRRYEAGLLDALELRLALSNQAVVEAALPARELALDAARRRLELLVGRYPAGVTGPALGDDPPAWPALPAPVPAGLPSELLTRRPDLLAAERRLAAAGLGVEQARAALYPRLTLTGSAGGASSELQDLLDSDFSVWSLAAGLLQPVFQGGRLRAGVDLAEARRREAALAWSEAAARAFAEVESALAAEAALAQQDNALAVSERQAIAARDLAEERYGAGLVEYLVVLDAQRTALAAQSQLLEVRRRRLDARVDLHLALGGGFSTLATAVAATADMTPTGDAE